MKNHSDNNPILINDDKEYVIKKGEKAHCINTSMAFIHVEAGGILVVEDRAAPHIILESESHCYGYDNSMPVINANKNAQIVLDDDCHATIEKEYDCIIFLHTHHKSKADVFQDDPIF